MRAETVECGSAEIGAGAACAAGVGAACDGALCVLRRDVPIGPPTTGLDASADWLSCCAFSRDDPAGVGERTGAGIAAMGVPASTCGDRESPDGDPADVELRMAARRCCNVFMPVPGDVELLASGVL